MGVSTVLVVAVVSIIFFVCFGSSFSGGCELSRGLTKKAVKIYPHADSTRRHTLSTQKVPVTSGAQ